MTKNYNQFTFIEMGIEPEGDFKEQVRREAETRGWNFETVKGDMSMIQRLIDGVWDDKEFLVVPPGNRVVATYEDGLLAVEPVKP
jgi:hypothetical protein